MVHAAFFLLSPEEPAGLHLRTLASIASRIDEEPFLAAWRDAADEQALKEVLLHNDRFLSLNVVAEGPTAPLVGKALKDLQLPDGVLMALIHRNGEIAIPRGATVLEAGDRVTVLGEPAGIRALAERYRASEN
jgi:uncharacterized protein with PhoU and TrkA domain